MNKISSDRLGLACDERWKFQTIIFLEIFPKFK